MCRIGQPPRQEFRRPPEGPEGRPPHEHCHCSHGEKNFGDTKMGNSLRIAAIISSVGNLFSGILGTGNSQGGMMNQMGMLQYMC